MKQRGKQLLSVLLTLVMLLGMVPGVTLDARATEGNLKLDNAPHEHKQDGTAGEGETVTFTKFSLTPNNKVYTINPGSDQTVSYYLDADVEGRLLITGGTVNLCLNGHKIDAAGTNNSAITVSNGATLHLCDCHAHSTDDADKHYYKVENGLGVVQANSNDAVGRFVGGYITGGSTGSTGGGLDVSSGNVYLYDVTIIGNSAVQEGGGVSLPSSDGTFSFKNVNIIGNKAGKGGGIFAASPITVSGGSISDNTANTYGGGVEFNQATDKTLALSGVTMSRNKAGTYGGGVHMNSNNATLDMTGGTITDNTAGIRGGGVDFATKGILNLSGIVTITGNKLSNSPASNVYLVHDTEHSAIAFVTIGESGISSTSRIGITVGSYTGKGVFTKGIADDTARDAAKPYFFSDDPKLSVLPATEDEGKHQLKLDVLTYAKLEKLTITNSTKAERNGTENKESTYPWVGDVLQANVDGATPVTYQWYRVNADGTETKIDGATEQTYKATAADVDCHLKVVATQSVNEAGETLNPPITKSATIGPVALRPAPTNFTETHPTYPNSTNGQITKNRVKDVDIDNYDNLYYSADNGATWIKVGKDGETDNNLSAGTYLFTYRNSDGSLPESKIATVILTAQYDLIWLKITSTNDKKANEVWATVKAVTNLDEKADNLPKGTTLTYNWYFIDKDGYKSDDPITTDSATCVIEERHAGGKLLVEAVWKDKDNEGKTIKSLSTPTPIILIEAPATYSVSGNVNRAANASDNTGTACASATVELRQGNTVIATATTDNGGNYSFATRVPNGEYNIVVTKDGVTKTERVTVSGGDATRDVLLPFYDVSSLIVVQGNTPAVVVSSLDKLAATQSAGINNDSTAVEVKLTVEGKEDLTKVSDTSGWTAEQIAEQTHQIDVKEKAKATTGADTVVEFLDMGIVKSTTTTGNTTTETIRDTGENILKIRIPYTTEGRYQFGIYRKHVDDTNVETTIAFANNSSHSDGTFEVGDGYLDVYATKFSTYAIGYTTTPPAVYSSGAAAATYPVTVNTPTNGTAKADKSSAAANAKVTVTAAPNDGCKVNTVIVTDQDGKVIPVSRNANGTYSFTMPASAVTVNVTFAKVIASPKDTGVADWLITDDHIIYIRGYDDGTISPNNNITRAEVSMIFYRLLLKPQVEIVKTFPDVKDTEWYATAVNTLANLGIVNGCDDGLFHANNPITRAEFAAIATRFAKATGGTVSFKDVASGHWAYGNIATAADYGWVTGYEGMFRPADKITRAETATIVNHMLGRAADQEYVLSNSGKIKNFPDLQDATKWYYFDMVEASSEHDFKRENDVEKWKE